jgi:hypothetical protein
MVHGEVLVLPYGFGDRAIGIALVDLPMLLDRMRSPARSHHRPARSPLLVSDSGI